MVFGKQTFKRYESNRRYADGVRVENIPKNHNVGTPQIQSLMRDLLCEPEHVKDRIIFMSIYNDTAWREKGNVERCEYNSKTVAEYARRFPRGHWSFLGPGTEKKWHGTYTDKPDKSWDRMAEEMMLNFSDSGHPIFRASSAFERGESRSKGAWQEVYTLQR